MDINTMRNDCALMLHDPSFNEISQTQWLAFFRSAAQDARSAGWLLAYEDDESITVDATSYEYTIPQPFAYVEKLLISSHLNGATVYLEELPRPHYEIRLNGNVPVFAFNTITQLVIAESIKVVGQKRPTLYTDAAQEIDSGMESFIRERALYFAFRFTGAGSSELATFRRSMATQCWQTSELYLHRHPQEFRQRPSAQEVPGRG
jgi:hypothetical protein